MMENDIDEWVEFYCHIVQIYTGYHMGWNLDYTVKVTHWISHEHGYKEYSGNIVY